MTRTTPTIASTITADQDAAGRISSDQPTSMPFPRLILDAVSVLRAHRGRPATLHQCVAGSRAGSTFCPDNISSSRRAITATRATRRRLPHPKSLMSTKRRARSMRPHNDYDMLWKLDTRNRVHRPLPVIFDHEMSIEALMVMLIWQHAVGAVSKPSQTHDMVQSLLRFFCFVRVCGTTAYQTSSLETQSDFLCFGLLQSPLQKQHEVGFQGPSWPIRIKPVPPHSNAPKPELCCYSEQRLSCGCHGDVSGIWHLIFFNCRAGD